jgi:uncharacterized membrane protein
MTTIKHTDYRKKQKILFIWTIVAVLIFILAWTAGIYRQYLGFDPHWAGDNFVFNLTYLFPATIFSTLVCYFTGGLTVMNWKSLPNKKLSIVTVLLSLFLIFYVSYGFLMVLRQH